MRCTLSIYGFGRWCCDQGLTKLVFIDSMLSVVDLFDAGKSRRQRSEIVHAQVLK